MAIAGSTVRAFQVQMRDGKPTATGPMMNVHPSAAYSDKLSERKGSLDDAIAALGTGKIVMVDGGSMQFVELCKRMDRGVLKQECHQ